MPARLYRAVCDSYGYLGRLWKAGDIVEVPEGKKPPPSRHFVAADAPKVGAEKKASFIDVVTGKAPLPSHEDADGKAKK